MMKVKNYSNQNIYYGVVGVLLFILYIITLIFKTNLIISFGTGMLKILQFGLLTLLALDIILGIYKIILTNKKNTSLRTKNEVYSNKTNYKDIISTKNEVIKLLNSLPSDSEESIQSKDILRECLQNIESMESVKQALDLILNRSGEYSLSEVINTIKSAEQSICLNIFKITNRIVLELSIEGFDRIAIDKYLDNIAAVIEQCSQLVKVSLSYVESKDSQEGTTEYINSMQETISKLANLNNRNLEINKGEE